MRHCPNNTLFITSFSFPPATPTVTLNRLRSNTPTLLIAAVNCSRREEEGEGGSRISTYLVLPSHRMPLGGGLTVLPSGRVVCVCDRLSIASTVTVSAWGLEERSSSSTGT